MSPAVRSFPDIQDSARFADIMAKLSLPLQPRVKARPLPHPQEASPPGPNASGPGTNASGRAASSISARRSSSSISKFESDHAAWSSL